MVWQLDGWRQVERRAATRAAPPRVRCSDILGLHFLKPNCLRLLNVTHEAGVGKAFRDLAGIVERLGARQGGVLVSVMAAPGHEIIVGVTRDLQFGHAVMFGMGGTLVEVLRDVSFRIVPFSEKDAQEMIAETRGAKLLQGVRGGKPADLAALARFLVDISDLVEKYREIDEMDLNPVIVHEKGLMVADARVVLSI